MDVKRTRNETIVPSSGKTLRGNDRIRILVNSTLKMTFHNHAESVYTKETEFGLLDYIAGFKEALIPYSICRMGNRAGTICQDCRADFPPHANRCPYYAGFPEMASLAKKFEIPSPRKVHITTDEVNDSFRVVTTCLSPGLLQKLPQLLFKLEKILPQNLNDKGHDKNHIFI